MLMLAELFGGWLVHRPIGSAAGALIGTRLAQRNVHVRDLDADEVEDEYEKDEYSDSLKPAKFRIG